MSRLSSFVQEPPCGGECLRRGAGQSCGLSGVPAPAPGLLQGHLGLPVLPGYCQLSILITEGTLPLDVDGQFLFDKQTFSRRVSVTETRKGE